MKHLKITFILLMLLTSIFDLQTSAQDFSSLNLLNQLQIAAREKEVRQDNEYASTGYEEGIFLSNPLMLDGKPLNYGQFNLASKGGLTVSKGAAISGQITQIPFHAYLRRNGTKVLLPGMETCDRQHTKIEVSEILIYANPGDQLVIEPVRKEDGPAKRILKLLKGGC